MPWWMAYIGAGARDAERKADQARRRHLHDAAMVRRKKRKRGGKK